MPVYGRMFKVCIHKPYIRLRIVILIVAVVVAAVAVLVPVSLYMNTDGVAVDGTPPDKAETEIVVHIQESHVIMPTKSSRPGCEEDNTCYIPDVLEVPLGSTITWENRDAAFHSVTSGVYGNSTDMFDSGHMEPGEIFGYTFEYTGSISYHCTLHPWMNGTILVS